MPQFSIADRLKKLRTDAGLTQSELADRADLSRTDVTRFENGRRAPLLAHLQALAAGLGVSLADLLEERVERRSVPIMGYVGAGAQVEPEMEQIPANGLEWVEVDARVPEDIIGFIVRGNSMYPRYDDGDLILVYRTPKRAPDTFVNEEAIVLTQDGRRFVKVLERRGDQIDLRSWNAPAMSDVDVAWIGQIYMRVPAAQLRRH